MRKVVPSLLVVMFGASSAFGATVIFDPAVAEVAPGEAAVFQISLGGAPLTGETIKITTLIFGSLDGLAGMSFDYAQTFLDTATIPPPLPQPFFVYGVVGGTDLGIAGNNTNGWPLPLDVGTLTVPTAGLAPDTFWDIMVSSSQEVNMIGIFLSSVTPLGGGLGDEQPVEGIGTVHVIPEPATLALLAIGGLAVVRRRKKA